MLFALFLSYNFSFAINVLRSFSFFFLEQYIFLHPLCLSLLSTPLFSNFLCNITPQSPTSPPLTAIGSSIKHGKFGNFDHHLVTLSSWSPEPLPPPLSSRSTIILPSFWVFLAMNNTKFKRSGNGIFYRFHRCKIVWNDFLP